MEVFCANFYFLVSGKVGQTDTVPVHLLELLWGAGIMFDMTRTTTLNTTQPNPAQLSIHCNTGFQDKNMTLVVKIIRN